MKKIFTLLTMALLAIGAQAQTATDYYLDIAQYATLDNIDLKNCTKLYSYDAEKKVLVVSAYAVQQSSASNQDEGKIGLGWFTYTASNSAGTSWDATGDFNGSAFYGTLSGGSASDRGINTKNHYSFFVTNVIKVSALIHSKSKSRTVTMDVYPVTIAANGDVTRGTKAGTASDNTNSITTVTVDGLDASTIYEVEFYSSDDNGGHLYEVAFYGEGGEAETPATPHAATVWDFTKTTVELLNPAYWTEDANTPGRYTYGTEIASDTFKDLGELGCSEGLGLLVGRSGNKLAANSIRVDIGKQIQINASNGVYKITDLAKDDVVRIRYKSASDEVRKFTVTNGDVAELEAPANSAEKAEQEATITVAADGDLLLTQSKAINVYAITVNAALPEVTGISTINAETATDAVIYNLSGQRVDESYRGVVIKNGKKVVIK